MSQPLAAKKLNIARVDVRDWFALLKPRVISLVVLTGAIGLFLAPGGIAPWRAIAAIACIAIGAGAAGAINMWYDRDIDVLMRRTASRPIPMGRVGATEALVYGVVLAAGSVIAMAAATNLAAAAWLALSILFYVLIYTAWLKRRTPQNIVIGGAAGAFPPIIGWVAVTGHLALLPVLLFAIVFFWTPPHFWSLSLYACDDYNRAGVPMLPVVAGRRVTRRYVMAYTIVLTPVTLSPWFFGVAGPLYGVAAALLCAGFLVAALRVLRDRQDAEGRSLTNDRPARAAFRYSLGFLAAVFAAVLVDHLIG